MNYKYLDNWKCHKICDLCKQWVYFQFMNYYIKRQKILYFCAKEYNYFLSKANVVGMGLGYKISGGINTLKECILVFVSEKIPYNDIPYEDLIPAIYKGIETDVIQTGVFLAQSLKERIRPVVGGCSIGPKDRTTLGSVACLVTNGTDKFVLSNNHVLADENIVPLGTPILQPAPQDKGKYPTDVIANLTKFIPLKFETNSTKPINFVDCAMAKIVNDSIATGEIKGIGYPKGIGMPKLEQNVQLVGRTSGKRKGNIISLGNTIEVEYDRGKALFVNQILTTDMSQGGDSGALLLNENNYAVGLLACGTQLYSSFNLINNVVDELQVDIITK
ncbi:hypothetical protein CLOHAE12215_02246 [Clostridium haemolyticum]|uniref:S1 family peptidase n=1 Tax=Clostridium haemolyticum TaxID=84025 RepID=UPI001C397364|nr:S1 family peptidase [Clostridium haemolyticum]CAG7840822.1 hypothetical protein CLOHAE12215_02246 [Clostridium haemolyticum]